MIIADCVGDMKKFQLIESRLPSLYTWKLREVAFVDGRREHLPVRNGGPAMFTSLASLAPNLSKFTVAFSVFVRCTAELLAFKNLRHLCLHQEERSDFPRDPLEEEKDFGQAVPLFNRLTALEVLEVPIYNTDPLIRAASGKCPNLRHLEIFTVHTRVESPSLVVDFPALTSLSLTAYQCLPAAPPTALRNVELVRFFDPEFLLAWCTPSVQYLSLTCVEFNLCHIRKIVMDKCPRLSELRIYNTRYVREDIDALEMPRVPRSITVHTGKSRKNALCHLVLQHCPTASSASTRRLLCVRVQRPALTRAWIAGRCHHPRKNVIDHTAPLFDLLAKRFVLLSTVLLVFTSLLKLPLVCFLGLPCVPLLIGLALLHDHASGSPVESWNFRYNRWGRGLNEWRG